MQTDARTVEKTLAELATTVPGAAGVFRRHRLDFCCNGQRTLEQACIERAADLAAVEAELEALVGTGVGGLEHLRELTPAELVDHIEQHYHALHRVQLEDLLALARRVEQRHAENPECPRGLAARLARGADELASHMMKEEHILFPAIRRGMRAELAGPVAMMRQEHDEHGEFLAELGALTKSFQPPEGACNSWRALYLGLAELEKALHEHVLVENHILFPQLVPTH